MQRRLLFPKLLDEITKVIRTRLEWHTSINRHAFGIEKIPVEQIIPRQQLPDFITREGDLDIFRTTGDKHVFVGLQQGKIFYIFFIEASFGDVYKH